MLNGVSGGKVVVRGRGGSLRLIRDEKVLVEGERKGSELREGKFCYSRARAAALWGKSGDGARPCARVTSQDFALWLGWFKLQAPSSKLRAPKRRPQDNR